MQSNGETRCKNYKIGYCVICRIGYRSSKRICLMKVFLQSHGETPSSSHELPMELRAKVEPGSGKHSFYSHFPKDPKVLSEGSESLNNHRYAVVVQDLATRWIQAYPCKTKTSQETQRSLQKFLELNRKPKVIHTDNSLQFGCSCEELSWNHCTSTPHRSETHGIAERAVRRVKEGTSAVLLQSGGQ